MIVSFHYTAYEGFYTNHHIAGQELSELLPFAELWAHYISGFFVKAYLQEVEGTSLIPGNKEDLATVLNTFLMEKSLSHFTNEMKHRVKWSIVPLRIIKSLLGIQEERLQVLYE